MNEIENALRLIEKINDRHEQAIEESRKEISELRVHASAQEEKIKSVTETQTKIEQIQNELQLFKAKLTGGIAIAVAVMEVIKTKFFG